MDTTATMLVSKSATVATSLFQDGFAAYCEGQRLEDMPTEAQRRGWWSALNAQAHAEYEREDAIESDYDWIRGGC